MEKVISPILLIVLIVFIFNSCTKEDMPETQTPGVYVVGYENDGTKLIAKLWKDGIATSLTNGSKDGVANSVFVSGSDVYVAGSDGGGAKYWKNPYQRSTNTY